jgi:hypothetical protein
VPWESTSVEFDTSVVDVVTVLPREGGSVEEKGVDCKGWHAKRRFRFFPMVAAAGTDSPSHKLSNMYGSSVKESLYSHVADVPKKWSRWSSRVFVDVVATVWKNSS